MEKSYAEHYAPLEREHWWFRARRMILQDLVAQLEWPQQPRTLELVMPIDDIRIRRRLAPFSYRKLRSCLWFTRYLPFKKMATFSRDTVYAPLRTAWLYNLFQRFAGGSRDRADFVSNHVLLRPGEKVVDAGCGPGSALEFLPLVNYFGFDPNPDYIRLARSRYGNRGEFVCGDASNPQVQESAQGADAFLSLGVLHHLTDKQIGEMLALARACLRPGGRFIFYEPCFSANDDWVGRVFMRLDRGGNIKTDQAWRALISEYFATVEEHIRRPVYLFRYTVQTLIGRNPRSA